MQDLSFHLWIKLNRSIKYKLIWYCCRRQIVLRVCPIIWQQNHSTKFSLKGYFMMMDIRLENVNFRHTKDQTFDQVHTKPGISFWRMSNLDVNTMISLNEEKMLRQDWSRCFLNNHNNKNLWTDWSVCSYFFVFKYS